MAYLSPPQDCDPVFCPFLRIFKSEFLVQDLISRLIVKGNGISIRQNLSLGVNDQKEMWDMAHSISLIKLYQMTMRKEFRFFVSDHLHDQTEIKF